MRYLEIGLFCILFIHIVHGFETEVTTTIQDSETSVAIEDVVKELVANGFGVIHNIEEICNGIQGYLNGPKCIAALREKPGKERVSEFFKLFEKRTGVDADLEYQYAIIQDSISRAILEIVLSILYRNGAYGGYQESFWPFVERLATNIIRVKTGKSLDNRVISNMKRLLSGKCTDPRLSTLFDLLLDDYIEAMVNNWISNDLIGKRFQYLHMMQHHETDSKDTDTEQKQASPVPIDVGKTFSITPRSSGTARRVFFVNAGSTERSGDRAAVRTDIDFPSRFAFAFIFKACYPINRILRHSFDLYFTQLVGAIYELYQAEKYDADPNSKIHKKLIGPDLMAVIQWLDTRYKEVDLIANPQDIQNIKEYL
jgi:hypothetical protein